MSATTLSRLRQTTPRTTAGQQNSHLNTASLIDSTSSTASSTTTATTSYRRSKANSRGSSSEVSDPLESDYDEDEDSTSKRKAVVSKDDDTEEEESSEENEEETDEDEDDDDGDEDEDSDDKAIVINSNKNIIGSGNQNINQKIGNNIDSKNDEDDDDDDDEEDDEEEDEEDDDDDDDDAQGAHIIDKNDKKGHRVYDLDDLQIIKTIGTGTFGRVYLIKDKRTDNYCAMKILSMTDVIRLKQVDHVKNEKSILAEVQHPFIVNLKWSTKDDSCLYMLFEYVCGGELFSYLRNAGRFSSPTANFYTCEIILALEYLHSLSIVYRDLKPENLLINRDGHLKITDFGFAKKLKDRTWTLCGTPEYLAPEIIQSKGHNRAVDWWALGVLIYEMLVGYPPFYDDNPFGIYEKILSGKIEWPKHIDPVAKDLIKKLLVLDRTKRMGNMKNGAEDVKRHRWFKHLNWNDVLNKKLTPPIMPEVNFDGDTRNFDEYPEAEWKPARSLSQSEMQLFNDF